MAQAKIFFDTNILLGALSSDRHYAEEARRVITEDINMSTVSSLTVHLVFYFGLKAGFSFDDLVVFVKSFEVLAIDNEVVEWAYKNCQGNDFEDALQVGCAVVNNIDKVVTADKKMYECYNKMVEIELLR